MTEIHPDIDLDSMDPDLRRLVVEVGALRQANHEMAQRIGQQGGVISIGVARVEHFMSFLVEAGILTEIQGFEEQKAWELHFRGQMKEYLKILEATAEQRAAEQRKSSLLVPPGARIPK